MPRASRFEITWLSAGDTLMAIAPALASFFCAGVCLPVRTLITAAWLWRFSVSQSLANFGLSKTLSA